MLVGPDNLTWTFLKSSSTSHMENLTKNYRQHKLTINMMHEFFEPTKDPYMKTDTVDDVIFNRHKKFKGFYIAVLERNDEMISSAMVRVYSKVGEVLLVATKFRHQRLEICQILVT